MPRIGVACGLLLGVVVGACLDTPADLCHQQAIAGLGCCPFCDEECEVPREEIEKTCGALADLDELDEEDAPPAPSDTQPPPEPRLPSPR